MHQNSHSSSWSIVSWEGKEVVSHSGFNTWGLERSLGFYISSFLTTKFETQRGKYKVWACTDVGLILITEVPLKKSDRSMYVANPFTQECVEIPSHAHLKGCTWPLGIATRTENGVLLDYKVVLLDLDTYINKNLRLLIYTSETGLWSLNVVHVSMSSYYTRCPISLHGTIHWIAGNSSGEEDVVISIDLYATGSVQCRVTPFPDSGKHPRFIRSCTSCQGFLMYMNIVSVTKVDGSLEDKLCVWRLKSEGWQLVSEISLDFIDIGFEYFPLGINPFDAKTVFCWSTKDRSVISINLRNGMFELHKELERSRNGRTQSSFEYNPEKVMEYVKGTNFLSCAFPVWLHRIPVRRVTTRKMPTTDGNIRL